MFSRTDGAANTAVYRKESGSGNTGWTATSNAAGAVTSVDGRSGAVTLNDLYIDVAGDTMTGALVVNSTVDATLGFRHGSAAKPSWTTGAGSPEGVVTAPVGSLFSRTDGNPNTAAYRKVSGTGNTGWLPVQDVDPVWVGPSAPAGTPTSGDMWYDVDQTGQMGSPLLVASGGTSATNAAQARINLGIPAFPLGLADGGTGGTTAPTARTALAVPAIGNSTSVAGPPSTGTWARCDQWVDSVNVLWTCTVAGTPGTWVAAQGVGTELAYNQITASANITGTTAAGANLLIEGTTRSYDGNPIIVELYTFAVQAPNAANVGAYISLWDGGTDIGYLADVFNGSAVSVCMPVYARRRLVPSVGTHNYRITGWIQGGAASVLFAGPGGAASFPPAYIRVTRA
jgi:hypothetical protein